MLIADDLVERLRAVDWLGACGTDGAHPLITGWDVAVEHCEGVSWTFAQEEAAARMTVHLHNHAMDEYLHWNERVLAAKATVLTPVVLAAFEPRRVALGLPEVVRHCVQWDVLHALMEHLYADAQPFRFFDHLLGYYEQGRMPCGWLGHWPEGELLWY